MLISYGRIVSQSYTNENCVCPVAMRGVVLLTHRIEDGSSAHLPFLALRMFLQCVMIALLLDLAYIFA